MDEFSTPILIGREYSFKDQFLGNVNLKLIGKIRPSNHLSRYTYVWYHEKLGYAYAIGNDYEKTEELTPTSKEQLSSLIKIIEDNEVNQSRV